MRKPSVNLRCVANTYTSDDERIVEVSSAVGGCLISLRIVDGRLIVEPYRGDPTVVVRADGRDIPL